MLAARREWPSIVVWNDGGLERGRPESDAAPLQNDDSDSDAFCEVLSFCNIFRFLVDHISGVEPQRRIGVGTGNAAWRASSSRIRAATTTRPTG